MLLKPVTKGTTLPFALGDPGDPPLVLVDPVDPPLAVGDPVAPPLVVGDPGESPPALANTIRTNPTIASSSWRGIELITGNCTPNAVNPPPITAATMQMIPIVESAVSMECHPLDPGNLGARINGRCNR